MISGKILRDAIISGANNINNQRSRVDELNVFPVPDGDTGTNMSMTMGAAREDLLHNDYPAPRGAPCKIARITGEPSYAVISSTYTFTRATLKPVHSSTV